VTDTTEPGWVEALPPADADGMVPQVRLQPERRGRVAAALILTVVIVAAIGVAAAWRGRTGDPLASARMVPADVDFAVTIDVLQLGEGERLERLVATFADPLFEAGTIAEPFDLVEAIDEAMLEETGLTLSDDVLPWIGRSATMAVSMGDLGILSDFAAETTLHEAGAAEALYRQSDLTLPGVLVAAGVRDHAAADAFVEAVVALVEEEGGSVTPRTIAGFDGYDVGDGMDMGPILVVLTDDMLLVGTDTMVSQSLALDGGAGSLATDRDYQSALSRLPQERVITAFFDMSFLEGLAGSPLGTGITSGLSQAELGTYAVSVSVVDEGVRLNYAFEGDLGGYSLSPDREIVDALPADTVAFLSVDGGERAGLTDDLDPALRGQLDSLGAEFEAMTGVDLLELIAAFSGKLTVAVTETRQGSIAEQAQIPVGVVGVIGLLDRGPIDELLGLLDEVPADSGLELTTDGNLISLHVDGQEMASFSVSDDRLVVGSGRDLVTAVVEGTGEGLTGSSLYRELDGLIAGDGLIAFADVSRLAGLVPMEMDERSIVERVRGIGAGIETDGGGSSAEVLILIDY